MTRETQSRLGLVAAFAATIAATSLITALMLREGTSRAEPPAVGPGTAPATPPVAPPPPAPAGDWMMSAYFDNATTPTNGFVVINRRTGKVSNCIANWQGKKEARCHDWSSWVKLP